MRLHHLSVTAFGPFVDGAEVDFDALSESGLFLLSGATGSGKSSVLDAVCFALYGAVPGDRQQAGRLRSDQAPPGLAPSVQLDVTVAGRRLRIVRSPAWERPKKRGSGTTREQAKVTVTEHGDGEWRPLTSRLDEAGDLLSGLLGMNLDQFCQVALLPQGHFQAFLRADSAQRHRLLARLFRTGRFERVESWLRDHRIALRRDSDRHGAIVGDLVSRLSETAHRPVPDDLADLEVVSEAAVSGWAREIGEDAEASRRATRQASQAAAERHEAAAATAGALRELAAARVRVLTATETLDRLELAGEHHAAEVARLERARRAEGVRPLARLVRERERAVARAQDRATASRASALHAGLAVDDLETELERIADDLAALTALLPSEQRLDELHVQVAQLSQRAATLTHEDELAAAESDSLAQLSQELTDQVASAEQAARDLPAAEAEVARLRVVAAAHDTAARATAELRSVSVDHAEARSTVVELRTHLLDLRERRIAGMAAELAGSLVVGGGCPVCGSSDHPHPATPSSAHPDADAEREAQRAVDDAQATELALQLRLRELERELSTAQEAVAGTDLQSTRDALAAAEVASEQLGDRAAACADLRGRLAAAEERATSVTRAAAERRIRRTELTTGLEHLCVQEAELAARVIEARGEHPELRAAVAAVTARRDLARSVHTDDAVLSAARDALADAATALSRAVLEAGFDTADEARQAALDADETAALEQAVQGHRTAWAAARQVLDEPEARQLLATPAPDVPAAEAAARDAAEALERCRADAQVAATTGDRVRRLVDLLESALADRAPVREQLALATRVSAFVEGKAPDNRLQMRLSAYVLAFRLSQVVAAANARLAGMSDRRYSLEHVGRRGAGETRGGLSLVVRDDWSGESRDPATLSGGETFVVSLALALGLADVVAHEAGGADLQTLFVDEGFGSLDAETLDDVLDILDTLRENGRVVGVVSHVPEMRDRIPTQLVVTKARAGSTLRVAGSDR